MSEGRARVSKLSSIVFYISSTPLIIGSAAAFLHSKLSAGGEINTELGQTVGGLIAILSLIAPISFVVVAICQIGIWTDWFASGRNEGEKRPRIPFILLATAALLALLSMQVTTVDVTVELPTSKTLPSK
jgi:amino acid transporter